MNARAHSARRRAYHQYGFHVPAPDANLKWLSLMQHHGAPTRLLDFSYSLYVAGYFALESAEDKDCAVFAINGPWAVKQSIAALNLNDRLRALPGLDGYAASLGIYHPVFSQRDWPI